MESNLSILRFYKRRIVFLKGELDSIDPSSKNLIPLLNFQSYLLKQILKAEDRISAKKVVLKNLKIALKNSRLDKKYSKLLRESISEANESISGQKYLLYLWRCFGDGVVFKYISKWNLKRFLYEADTPSIKQSSGNIGGKSGFDIEWEFIQKAAAHNVPAILCDLTNVIRHGDLCLLGDSDPLVIEVKSSKNTNKRVERQLNAIGKIHKYLYEDEGEVGGIDNMRRVDLPVKERHHNGEINRALKLVKTQHSVRIDPEPGLSYIAINTDRSSNYSELLKGIGEPIVYMLNQAKTERRWDNYYPFVLSITNAEALYSFLSGEIYLVVVLDATVLKKMASEIGYELSVPMNENESLVFKKEIEGSDEPFVAIVSEHFVGRIGLEFLSLEWFFEHEKVLLDDLKTEIDEAIQES